MSELKTYQGGCHCGAVRYEVQMQLGKAIECNCSICSKKGSLLAFVPASQFKLVSGEGVLTDYQFNRHIIHHLFCSKCGIASFSRGKSPDGTDTRAINVRCLDDIDLSKVERVFYDGKSH